MVERFERCMREKRINKQKIWDFFVFLLILAGEYVFFHNILFNDSLIGGRIDSKLNTFFVEHWYQVILGNEIWTELDCFYPAKHVLSYSDMMLGFSFPYIVFRIFGINMYVALKCSVIFFHALGSFSMYYFMKRCLGISRISALISVISFSFSNSYYFIMVNIQMTYLSTLPLILIFIYYYWENRDKTRRILFGLLATVVLVLQFYTAFYVGYLFLLLVLSAIPVTMIAFFVCRRQEWCAQIIMELKNRWKDIAFYAVVAIMLMLPFVYLYLPTLAENGGRNWGDVFYFIPEPQQVLGLAEADKSLMQAQHLEESKYNLTLGIPWIDVLVFISLFMAFIWKYCIKQQKISELKKTSLICLCILILLCFPLAMKFGDFSPWYFIYRFIPGASAVRAVPRWYNMLTIPLAIALGLLIQYVVVKGEKFYRFLAPIFATVIFVSNIFTGGTCSDWSVSGEEAYIAAVPQPPADCEIMYLTDKQQSSQAIEAELQMDAWTIAKYYNMDTVNGYSGQEPLNWNISIKSENVDRQVTDWLQYNHVSNKQVYAFDIGNREWTRLVYEGE